MTAGFRSILVPLDGSTIAEEAIAVGASLVRRGGATLHLVSVHEPVSVTALAEVGGYGAELEQEQRAGMSRYLTDTVEAVRAAAPVALHGELLDGEAAEAIARYVAAHGIDLVVMTTHARKGLARWTLGSVADRLLRQVSVPVLLLHPSDQPQPTRFHRLLVALDGQIEEPVLRAATALGGFEEGTEYVLLRVVEPPVPLLSSLAASPSQIGQPHADQTGEGHAVEYLERVATRLRGEGRRVSWRVVYARDVPVQVTTLARQAGADCIAVGTHGAGGIERLLTGSVADQIVRDAALPVLVSPLGKAQRG